MSFDDNVAGQFRSSFDAIAADLKRIHTRIDDLVGRVSKRHSNIVKTCLKSPNTILADHSTPQIEEFIDDFTGALISDVIEPGDNFEHKGQTRYRAHNTKRIQELVNRRKAQEHFRQHMKNNPIKVALSAALLAVYTLVMMEMTAMNVLDLHQRLGVEDGSFVLAELTNGKNVEWAVLYPAALSLYGCLVRAFFTSGAKPADEVHLTRLPPCRKLVFMVYAYCFGLGVLNDLVRAQKILGTYFEHIGLQDLVLGMLKDVLSFQKYLTEIGLKDLGLIVPG